MEHSTKDLRASYTALYTCSYIPTEGGNFEEKIISGKKTHFSKDNMSHLIINKNQNIRGICI